MEDDSFLHDFFSFAPKRALERGGKANALSTARSTIVDVVRNSQTGMPAFLSGVTGRFAQFIEKSGFLSIQAECSPPLPVLEALNDPAKLEKLSVKATYSQ